MSITSFYRLKRVFLIILIAFLNLGCDQVSKQIVRTRISSNQYMPIIGDYLVLTKVENPGAAMSLGSDLSPLLKIVILQLIPLFALIWLIRLAIIRTSYSVAKIIGLACIMGGGIGNLYDRIVHGSVTDFVFIDLGGILKTGIFNMADVSVTIGVLIFIVNSIQLQKRNFHTYN